MSKLNKFVTSQIESTTGAKHETNTYSYDSNGVLVRHDADQVGKLVVGPGVLYGANKDSAEQTGLNTIKLIPNEDLQSDQFLIIEPTSPNHIHIRAGGTQDESNASLILGGERNNVVVSDNGRNVVITTRPPLVANTYLNINPESDTSFVTGSTADIQTGYTVNVDGTDYIVDGVMPIDEGVIAVTATGAVFDAGQNYTFTFEPYWDNQWIFHNNGTLSGPTEPGWLQVSGILGEAGSNTNIYSQENIVLSTDENQGVFINDASNGANQVATIGDLAPYAPPVDTSFTVNGGSSGTQPTFDGAPLFTGSYVKHGDSVTFRINVDFTNITSFGTGQYYVDLPFTSKYGILMRDGCLHDFSNSNQWSISGHVNAGEDRLFLFFTNGTGQDEFFDHNSPITLAVEDRFHVSGSYIAQ